MLGALLLIQLQQELTEQGNLFPKMSCLLQEDLISAKLTVRKEHEHLTRMSLQHPRLHPTT